MRRPTTLLLVLLGVAWTAAAAAAAPPANDQFAAATVLAGDSGVVAGRNDEATAEPNEPVHWGSGEGRSVWYRWTAGSDGPVTFETCTVTFDSVLAVYTGPAPASLSRVGANDDACGVGSRVSFNAAAGTEYRIAVDGYHGAVGNFSLAWRRAPAPPVVVEWPTVSGDRIDGSTLTVSPGRWSGGEPITLTYRWRRCYQGCVEIVGATGQAYRVTSADVGFSLIAEVTATNAGGETSAQAWAGQIAAAPPHTDGAPSIEETPRAGRMLTVAQEPWSGTPPITLAYQWQSCANDEDRLVDAALRRSTRAPQSFPANPPSMAVDGDAASWWGAGSFAPSWIEIDLGVPTPVTQLRLVAAQTPTGLTVHRVHGRLPGENERLLQELGGTTADGDVLSQPLVFEPRVQFIRVETVLSPSWVAWREIEVLSRCRDVAGRTRDTYVPRIADIGSSLRLVVRASNAAGTVAVASFETALVRGCVVPRLVGAALRVARASLSGHGCRLGRVGRVSSSRPVGRVVSQALPRGAKRLFGARVNVVVSRG